MNRPAAEPLSVPLILWLHRQVYSYSGGRGGHLKTEDNVIARYDDGGRRSVVFRPPPWQQTESLLVELSIATTALRPIGSRIQLCCWQRWSWTSSQSTRSLTATGA